MLADHAPPISQSGGSTVRAARSARISTDEERISLIKRRSSSAGRLVDPAFMSEGGQREQMVRPYAVGLGADVPGLVGGAHDCNPDVVRAIGDNRLVGAARAQPVDDHLALGSDPVKQRMCSCAEPSSSLIAVISIIPHPLPAAPSLVSARCRQTPA